MVVARRLAAAKISSSVAYSPSCAMELLVALLG